jgi:uncharacterized membrane protein
MGVARSGLAVLFFAWALLLTGSADAQAQTFNFQVCNQSNVSASVAIENLVAVGDSRLEVQGWFTVAAGSCEMLGSYPQGPFYMFAEETDTQQEVWEGDVPLCVEYPGPFEVIHTTSITCQSDYLKQFTAETIPSNEGTFTWTLN